MILVVGGGGLNPNKPLIHVNAPLGSTVDFTLGGVIVKSIPPAKAFPNSDGETADYYYSCQSTGTYTVTATLGTDTASDTVTVDAAKQYNLVLNYALWLYKNGFVTAFPSTAWTKFQNSGGSVTITDTEIKFEGRAYDWGEQGYAITNAIDLTDYKTLGCQAVGLYSPGRTMRMVVSGRSLSSGGSSWYSSSTTATKEFTMDSQLKEYLIDLSSITGSKYIGFGGCGQVTIRRFWLSKD